MIKTVIGLEVFPLKPVPAYFTTPVHFTPTTPTIITPTPHIRMSIFTNRQAGRQAIGPSSLRLSGCINFFFLLLHFQFRESEVRRRRYHFPSITRGETIFGRDKTDFDTTDVCDRTTMRLPLATTW